MKRIHSDRPLMPSEKYKRYYEKHKQEILEWNRQYINKNRKKVNARIRLHKHGMTAQEHDVLLKKQRNCCAICREKFRKTPHIDHSHTTKKNRGLLCDDCNLGLGRFKDNVRFLKLAIKYLKKYQKDLHRSCLKT